MNKEIIAQLESFISDPELSREEKAGWEQILTETLDEENDGIRGSS